MTRELRRIFNEEVENYKNSLINYAKKCDWEGFKVKAGKLFDYLEFIELSEVKRRFMRIFKTVFFALLVFVVFIIAMGNPFPELQGLKNLIGIVAISAGCFELYFFMSFKMYIEKKMALYNKRRECFIRDIEQDFRNFILQQAI